MTTPHASPSGKDASKYPVSGRDSFPDPLVIVERGLAVFPLPRGGRVPARALKNWPNRCVSDPAVIRRCWRPGDNIGVGCKANGLLVVDLDRHHEDADGIETFKQLLAAHGQEWPETFTVRTPRGGLHLYFWAPRERALGNTASKAGPGIDSRGPGKGDGTDGGYVVGPGSIADGRRYEIARDLPVIDAPAWLVELLDPPQRPVKPVHTLPKIQRGYVRAAVEGEVQKILDSRRGGRNDQLNRSAFSLGTIVGAGDLGQDAAETALLAAAEAVGLIDDDGARQVEATIRSGLTAGIRRPRYSRGA
ncbi:bifunctional DNA primase/polymerase [Nonomuraea sp. NPDC004354]